MNTALDRETVEIPVGTVVLRADLVLPPRPHGLVILAHCCGSSRYSPRHQRVAISLQQRGFATLLLDLLTPHEEAAYLYTRQCRVDIERLATRISGATAWARSQPALSDLPIGYFAASTGAAAALTAATERGDVSAVVSRGGRPDLAGTALEFVSAPTLLIVGSADIDVIELNKDAMSRMAGVATLAIVAGATHLFEEAGTLEEVARLAGEWFEHYCIVRPEATAASPWSAVTADSPR